MGIHIEFDQTEGTSTTQQTRNIGKYGNNDLFTYASMLGAQRHGTDGQMGRLALVRFYTTTSATDLPLSDDMLAKMRRIFAIPNNRYVGAIYTNSNILYQARISRIGETSEAEVTRYPYCYNWQFTVNDEFPLVIDEHTADRITDGNITGMTITQPEMHGTLSSPTETLKYMTFANPRSVQVGDRVVTPFEDDTSGYFVNAFGPLDAKPLLSQSSTQVTALFILHHIMDDVNTYEEFQDKCYQTPKRSKIGYNVKIDLKSGIVNSSFSISERYTGIKDYEELATAQTYTEIDGVTLDRPYIGYTGIGTSYRVFATTFQGDTVISSQVLAAIDSPTYPYNLALDRYNLKTFCNNLQGDFKTVLHTESRQVSFSVRRNGRKLEQVRTLMDINQDTDYTGTPVYFEFANPFKNSSKATNETNTAPKFKETLIIEWVDKDKEPLVPIPETVAPDIVGMNKVFKMSQLDIVAFNAWLWNPLDDGFKIDDLKRVNNNPLDNILFLKVSPFDLETSGDYPVNIGNIEWTGHVFGRCKTYTKIKIGDINLTRYYGNFLDFTQTKFRMWLPFVGFVDLNQKELYDRQAELNLSINSDTFQAVYDLRLVDSNVILGTWECNVGLDLNITSSNLMGQLASMGTALLSANPLSFVDEAIKDPTQNKGNATANGSMAIGRYCFIEVIRQIYEEPENYAHTHGYPCNQTLNLASLQGYSRVTNAEMNGLPFEQNIIDSAKALLSEGVWF